MTDKEKEINKNNLIMEGLDIFMVGSLEDLNNNLKSLCLKYFPHKNIFVLNAFTNIFQRCELLYLHTNLLNTL